jgi:hypothetical protein
MTRKPQDIISQKLSLIQESEIALYSIEAGLTALEKNRPYASKPYYFTWLLLLSVGIERLMKVIICLREFEVNNKFPTKKSLKNVSHNINKLFESVLRECFTTDYLKKSFAQADYDILKNDVLMIKLLELLSDFAIQDRYIFMDKISEPGIDREWPKNRWEELERIALGDDVYFRLLTDDYKELKARAIIALKIKIEQLIRALTRLFIFGNLGNLGASQYSLISNFAHMKEDELGSKEYNE